MSSIRRVSVLLAASAFYLTVPACSTSTDEAKATAEANLSTVSPAAILGELAVGGTSSPVSYTSSSTYRAFSFKAKAGDRVEAWVRSSDGDAVAWVTDADFKTIATNDDAAPGTKDARVLATVEKTGVQYIVFREYDYERATFTVSLSEPGLTGSACTTEDAVTHRACGTCGTQAAVCQRDAGGALTWSELSPCQGEHGECVAGATSTEACGNCGTRAVTCTAQCMWSAGTCSSAPAQGCTPGSYDITNAGCADPYTYRVRACTEACSYEPFGTCQAAPTKIDLGPTVGSKSSTVVVLGGTLPVLSANSCPAAIFTNRSLAYGYTQVHNPHAKPMTVTLYHSLAPSSAVVDTAIAVYASESAPTTEAERRACLKASNTGTVTLTADSKFASLDSASKRVTIPAGTTYTVYSTVDAPTGAGAITVPVRLTVQTTSIEQ